MKLKPQGSENKEVILYNMNRQKEKKNCEIIKQNHKQKTKNMITKKKGLIS